MTLLTRSADVPTSAHIFFRVSSGDLLQISARFGHKLVC